MKSAGVIQNIIAQRTISGGVVQRTCSQSTEGRYGHFVRLGLRNYLSGEWRKDTFTQLLRLQAYQVPYYWLISPEDKTLITYELDHITAWRFRWRVMMQWLAARR